MPKNMKKTLYKQEIRELFQLGLPIVVSQLGTVAMGVADTIQVGQIPNKSADAVAAAGLSNVLVFTIAIIGILALGVIAPMISKAIAEDKPDEVGDLYQAAMRVAWLMAPISAIICIGMAFCLPFLNQDADVVALAIPFTVVISISILPLYLFSAMRQLTDGCGDTRMAMLVTLGALGLNIFLNWLLIPHFGLLGSGFATLISRSVMAIGLWFFIQQKIDYQSFINDSKANLKPYITRILTTGLPSGMQGFFEIAVFGAAVLLIGAYGKYQQAAHQIALNMCSISYMMITGVAAAGSIRVGHFWGLKDKDAMRRAGTTALILSTCVMSCSAILFFMIPKQLVYLYTTDIKVVSIAVELLIIGSFFQLSDGFQATAMGILRGISDVNQPTILSIFAYWVVGLPVGWVLAERFGMESRGVWVGLTASLTLLAGLLCWRFYAQLKKMVL
jgi:multidrug resistance protein, MATE family